MGFGTKIPLILGPKHIGLQRPKLPEHLRGAAWELLGGMKKITVVLVVFFCFPIFPLFFHTILLPQSVGWIGFWDSKGSMSAAVWLQRDRRVAGTWPGGPHSDLTLS